MEFDRFHGDSHGLKLENLFEVDLVNIVENPFQSNAFNIFSGHHCQIMNNFISLHSIDEMLTQTKIVCTTSSCIG